ncbi:polar amino acid transport system permease protein [Rhizobium sp. BIGb0125]|jgi:polar amino acid transport system permease protein|uniref:amino acid ABC transporter permease n=1 Tax=Rhizobium sp. BIGb0125 TaxID=2940618 RepID=UPI00216778E5|nr:amino acid ABC transporter permease [Rhizobium sp. BIGb0125]MCS4242582.1 polar amino acid transport system permease protein [Rhizobium sp. BIGb0125]
MATDVDNIGAGFTPVPLAKATVTRNIVVPRRHPGRWLAIAILAVVSLQIAQAVSVNPNFHWDVYATHLFSPQVIRGVGWTLILTVVAMTVAIVMAALLVIMRDSDNPVLRGIAYGWVWFFRGTPIYTQLLFWGLFAVLFPNLSLAIPFGPEVISVETKYIVTPAMAAILGLGFNESAYLTEIFRAGFNSLDRGQAEAAQALGMKPAKIWWRILMPQAMRVIIPPTGNETIGMLKMTSLVLAVPFTLDLTFATNAISNRLYLPIPLLLVAGTWYLAITSLLMVGQHFLERHFGKGVSVHPTRAE